MTLKLPRALLEEVRAHAAQTYPEECCGAMIGPVPGDFGEPGRAVSVTTVRPLPNAWEAPSRGNRYLLEPSTLAKLEREYRGTGTGVVGFYHSHPDAPDWPSPFDLLRAWPCYSYLIVSSSDKAVAGGRSWIRSEDGQDFFREPVIVE